MPNICFSYTLCRGGEADAGRGYYATLLHHVFISVEPSQVRAFDTSATILEDDKLIRHRPPCGTLSRL
jgi:hypothetical protein